MVVKARRVMRVELWSASYRVRQRVQPFGGVGRNYRDWTCRAWQDGQTMQKQKRVPEKFPNDIQHEFGV